MQRLCVLTIMLALHVSSETFYRVIFLGVHDCTDSRSLLLLRAVCVKPFCQAPYKGYFHRMSPLIYSLGVKFQGRIVCRANFLRETSGEILFLDCLSNLHEVLQQ